MGKCEIIELTQKLFFRTPIKERRSYHEAGMKITRKDTREHLEQLELACELAKLIRHFFPGLVPLLKKLPDPRNQSYTTYPGAVLLMTRILSSIFYISSMRKTSEEFNSDTVIENVWSLCGEEPAVDELPYWETINRYLKRMDPCGLQEAINSLCRRLLRSRAFEGMRIRGKYWQVIIDGTQLYSTRGELDEKSLYRIHQKGTEGEYRENYYYVLEAKLVLHPKIIVSFQTEFVENEDGKEAEKQDCERKACWRLMEKIAGAFPRLPICLCGDSLYACEGFFGRCREMGWRYILRYKEGSIPYIAGEYRALKEREGNYQERVLEDGKEWYDYVEDIDYNGYHVNLVEYGSCRKRVYKKGKRKGEAEEEQKGFWFATDFPVSRKNVANLVQRGRMRWKIENEGFNTQKKQGYYLEHQYSKDYQAMKNHYYLTQIGHMVAQVMEAWEKLWSQSRQSREQRHRRVLESFKKVRLKENREETGRRIQIRLEPE